MRLLVGAGQAIARWVARNPGWSAAALAAALWICHKRGYLKGSRWRDAAGFLWDLAQPLLEHANVALEESARIRGALIIVEPPPMPVAEQIAARHLARSGRQQTPAELRDALAGQGHHVPAAHLKRAMEAHRAFSRHPGDHYSLGRVPQIGGAVPPPRT